MTKLTKEQYVFMEDFGLKRMVWEEMTPYQFEELRRAVHKAILLFPFKSVEGMEEYCEDLP